MSTLFDSVEFFGSGLKWLAVQPPVDRVLSTLLATSVVRRLGMLLLDNPDVPPELLLTAILGLSTVSLLTIRFVPKARLALWATYYFFISKDKKTRKPNDDVIDFNAPGVQHIKVVFIRHGESAWNAVFNKGLKLLIPVRLLFALIREAFMIFEPDSLFIDSPLSKIGIEQAWELLNILAASNCCADPNTTLKPVKQLEVPELISIIRGDAGESIVVGSNLRRAISTGLICLSPRLLKTSEQTEKMLLLTPLQEISRQVDTLSLTPEHKTPQVPAGEAAWEQMGNIMSHFYRTRLNGKHNTGNKTLKQTAEKRQMLFTSWLFDQTNRKTNCVIVCGHSLWFREFFKSYLPKSFKHDAKEKKIVNCGIVAFDIYKNQSVLRIDPESIKVVHGGFERKGKDKKKV